MPAKGIHSPKHSGLFFGRRDADDWDDDWHDDVRSGGSGGDLGMGWDDVSPDHGADFDDRFSDYDYGGDSPDYHPDYDDY